MAAANFQSQLSKPKSKPKFSISGGGGVGNRGFAENVLSFCHDFIPTWVLVSDYRLQVYAEPQLVVTYTVIFVFTFILIKLKKEKQRKIGGNKHVDFCFYFYSLYSHQVEKMEAT